MTTPKIVFQVFNSTEIIEEFKSFIRENGND